VGKGGTGSISKLVLAIKSKNGMALDHRLHKFMIIEY
jgi:hypothetical protein